MSRTLSRKDRILAGDKVAFPTKSEQVLMKHIAGGGCGKKTASGGEIFNAAINAGQNAHAEGGYTTASGNCSHAEGIGSNATGENSHAEGSGATASGSCSHAEGAGTTASGLQAHAEGGGTIASGNYSHAGGESTIASQKNQTVIGKFNVEDTTGQYAFVIGDGTDDKHRHNLFAVGWNGKVYVNGTAIN